MAIGNELKTTRNFDYFIALGIFGLVVLWFYQFAPLRIDVHHDGLMLKTALDVYSGQVLFRDTFSQYGALTVYIQAASLALLGPTLLSLKTVTVLFYGVTAALQYLTWRFILPRSIAILGLVMWVGLAPFYLTDWVMLPWSSVYALTLQSAGLFLFGLLVRRSVNSRKTHLLAALCGVCAGLASWCRMPVGILLEAAFSCGLVVLTIARRRGWSYFLGHLMALALGCLVVWAAFLVPIFVHGAWSEWRYQVFVFPKEWMGGVSSVSFHRVRECLLHSRLASVTLVALLFLGTGLTSYLLRKVEASARRWIPFAGFAAWWIVFRLSYQHQPQMVEVVDGIGGGFMLVALGGALLSLAQLNRRALDEDGLIALVLCIGAVASWPQFFPVLCFRHVFWAVSPALGPVLYFLYRSSGKRPVVVAAIVIASLAPLIGSRQSFVREIYKTPYVEITEFPALKGMKTSPEDARWINAAGAKLTAYFKQNGASPILLETNDALFAALASDLRNPGPLFVRWGFNRADFIQRRLDFVRETRPVIVLTEHSPNTLATLESYRKIHNYVELVHEPRIEIYVPVSPLRQL